MDQSLIDQALALGPEDPDWLLFTKAIFPHPGDYVPVPVEEGGMQVAWEGDPDNVSTDIEGHVFFDGSGLKSPIVEMSRAGWGASVYSEAGELKCTLCGPVPRFLPQTSQAGEFCGLGATNELLSGPSTGYSDCANVVQAFKAPVPHQVSYKRLYAGALLNMSQTRYRDVIKVKAHVSDTGDLSPEQLFYKTGNDAADAAAKRGAWSHPMPSAAELVEIDRRVLIARKVCAMAAQLLPLWPRLSLDGVPRAPGESRQPADVPVQLHEWSWCRSFWRCQRCLKFRRSDHKPPSAGCSGVLPEAALEIGRMQHQLKVFDCSDGTLLYACEKCKAYSTGGQFRNLRKKCLDRPASNFAISTWSGLLKGRHPKFPQVKVEPFSLSA